MDCRGLEGWLGQMRLKAIGLGQMGRSGVCEQMGEGLIEKEVQGTVKFGGRNIIVWGCMGWNGVWECAEVEGRMDADQCVDILDNC